MLTLESAGERNGAENAVRVTAMPSARRETSAASPVDRITSKEPMVSVRRILTLMQLLREDIKALFYDVVLAQATKEYFTLVDHMGRGNREAKIVNKELELEVEAALDDMRTIMKGLIMDASADLARRGKKYELPQINAEWLLTHVEERAQPIARRLRERAGALGVPNPQNESDEVL